MMSLWDIKANCRDIIFLLNIYNTLTYIMVCMVTASLMSAIYEEHKDEDGFLYMTYSGENTFGSEYGL